MPKKRAGRTTNQTPSWIRRSRSARTRTPRRLRPFRRRAAPWSKPTLRARPQPAPPRRMRPRSDDRRSPAEHRPEERAGDRRRHRRPDRRAAPRRRGRADEPCQAGRPGEGASEALCEPREVEDDDRARRRRRSWSLTAISSAPAIVVRRAPNLAVARPPGMPPTSAPTGYAPARTPAPAFERSYLSA